MSGLIGSSEPRDAFPLPFAHRRASGTPAQGLRRPLADGLRGQVTLDRPWPGCGWESVPDATHSLFPLSRAAAELQGRRPKAAGALSTPPLFPGARRKKAGQFCPKAPGLLSFYLRVPPHPLYPLQKRPPSLLYFKDKPFHYKI